MADNDVSDAFFFCSLFRRAARTIRTIQGLDDSAQEEEARSQFLATMFDSLGCIEPLSGDQPQGILFACLHVYEEEYEEAIEILTTMADIELLELRREGTELDQEDVELDDREE